MAKIMRLVVNYESPSSLKTRKVRLEAQPILKAPIDCEYHPFGIYIDQLENQVRALHLRANRSMNE